MHSHAELKLNEPGDSITDDDHIAHCFDYLRQGIMCSADVTLESNTTLGTGWGSVHQCKNYTEIFDWANDNSVF